MTEQRESSQAQWQTRIVQAINKDPKLIEKTKYVSNFDQASTWWINPVNPRSLRLSRTAFYFVNNIHEWKVHYFKLTNEILPKTYLQLEQVFTDPYYIANRKELCLLGEQDAIMISLHANNLQQYLDSYNF